jgi:carboxylate-amine ligase
VGLSLCAAGTHPFNQRLAQVTPLARYCRQHEAGGYLSKLMMTFALHIHVGMPSGDTAMRIMTQLRPYLPIFLALSASSPFWQGHFTAYASFRQRFLAMMRSYGICPSFRNWQAFTEFLGLAKTSGMFESTRDVHWDLRPNSGFGTLEVRVMDAQPTLRECILLAALVHSLVVHLLHADEEEVGFSLRPQPWLIEKENHFRASRYGLDAAYIESGTGGSRPIRAIVEDMLVELAPTAAELQETPYLCDLQRHLHTGPSYLRQQQVFQAVGSLQGVTVALVEELAADLASGQDPLGAWLDGSAGRDQKVDATMTL